jgi:hypothetical protein
VSPSASAGLYPVTYSLLEAGAWRLDVTALSGVPIAGSPFAVRVAGQSAPDAASSLAYGAGLVGGVAGERFSFRVLARDRRQPEVQTYVIDSRAAGFDAALAAAGAARALQPEVRVFTCSAAVGSFDFVWAGRRVSVPFNSVAAQAKVLLDQHPAILALGGASTVAVAGGAAAPLCSSGQPGGPDRVTFSFAGVGRMDDASFDSAGLQLGNGLLGVVELSALRLPGEVLSRRAVLSFQCSSAAAGAATLSFGPLRAAATFAPLTATVADLVAALQPVVGAVTVSVASDPNSIYASGPVSAAAATSMPRCLLAGWTAGVVFDVRLDALVGGLEAPPACDDAAVNVFERVAGLAPHWGSYTLSYNGSTTAPILHDAPAADVAAALAFPDGWLYLILTV